MDSKFIFINDCEKEFRPYNENYYISADGDVYSCITNTILKHYIDHDGYHRVDIYIDHKPKHIKVHKLVYISWIGPIPKGMQINHIDDNKDHNHYSNLYLGNQKENINDCIKNLHRVGNYISLKIYDYQINKLIEFPSINDFIQYSGHSVANGSLAKCMSHKWFHERYRLISKESVTTIEKHNQIKERYQSFLNSLIMN